MEKKEELSPIESIMLENKGINLDLQLSAPVDMFTMLSQMTVKVPLSEIFRIQEHKSKALEWINGVGQYTNATSKRIAKEKVKPIPKPKEPKGIISQIPPRYLDNAMTLVVEDIDPFLLSLVVNGKTLKNCMIDSRASNTIMPFKVMESIGLKADTK